LIPESRGQVSRDLRGGERVRRRSRVSPALRPVLYKMRQQRVGSAVCDRFAQQPSVFRAQGETRRGQEIGGSSRKPLVETSRGLVGESLRIVGPWISLVLQPAEDDPVKVLARREARLDDAPRGHHAPVDDGCRSLETRACN